MSEIFAVSVYCLILLTIGFLSYRKQMNASDYLIGGRQMNFWLTALAAHASDMSSWLFLGLPAAIFLGGLYKSWYAVGLLVGMFINWQFVAPKIRARTEEYNSMTFSSYFESRFADTTGIIRIFTAVMSLVFYSIYIAAGVIGLGVLIQSLFHINYVVAITIGVCIVIPYLFFGGYKTLAWIDLFQGFFLLAVIVFVPLFALGKVGGFTGVTEALHSHGLSYSMIPEWNLKGALWVLVTICGWGLGYFGQPHIVTKFMGISRVSEIPKAKYVGMTWQLFALGGATLIGLVSIPYFSSDIANPEYVFIHLVGDLFPPLLTAFILCAALAATLSTIDSQILVLATSLTEDFYKRVFRKNATSKELLYVSRLNVLAIGLFAYIIAFMKIDTIYNLVFFAWAGLGSSFGPLILFSLYSRRCNKYGAWAGILLGGSVSIVWPLLHTDIPTIIPGFALSSAGIYLFSLLPRKQHATTTHE